MRHPIVTVTGRAFYDVGHASRNPRTNRRDYDRRLAVWEIHPVMKLIQSAGGSGELPTQSPLAANSAGHNRHINIDD
jgi:hypothetical protein